MCKIDKNSLRAEMRKKRKTVKDKPIFDNGIYRNLISLPEFKAAEKILVYASLSNEIDTDNIISYSLLQNKKVYAPCCRDKNGNMDFFSITSLSDLKTGHYGIREPDKNKSEILSDFSGSLVIVPALCYDKNGFRLGYGGGYYDRFLKNFSFICVGLCYNSFIINNLPRENHDISVDIIVTETDIIYCGANE